MENVQKYFTKAEQLQDTREVQVNDTMIPDTIMVSTGGRKVGVIRKNKFTQTEPNLSAYDSDAINKFLMKNGLEIMD